MAPMPHKRSRRDVEDDSTIINVESASSNLRPDSSRKKVRLSVNGASSASKPRKAREQSSDTSSGEDGNLPDADGYEPPPAATQYEIMRDGGFKHLENAEALEERATQRLLARSTQLGDNRAADNAIILEIDCINFMCHTRLHVDFGPLINFVVGENGSGKSAVLTAVTLCLGGKASSTNRGKSIKNLIKTGEETTILKVRLKNEGADAYRPDEFGPSIIVERQFSRTGSSSYKLKSDTGRTISTKKAEVDDMIEYYQLSVDNPMNVLTQDAAKSFITASTPAQKYQFFVEGVQLEALNNDYKMLSDTMDSIKNKLQDTEGDVGDLKKYRDEAQRKAELVEQRAGLRQKASMLGKQSAWAQVEEVERDLEVKEADVVAKYAGVQQQETVCAEKNLEFEEADAALEHYRASVEEASGTLEPLREEQLKAKSAHEDAREEVARLRRERDDVRRTMASNKTKEQHIQNDIATELKRIEDANGGAQARKLAEIEQARQAVDDAKAAQVQYNQEGPKLDEVRRQAFDDLKKKEGFVRSKRDEVGKAQEYVQSLGKNRGGPLEGFDQKMPQLVRAINGESKFRDRPIGPIGTHIKLLNPLWSQTIETVLGNTMNAFVVTSKSDQQILAGIKRRLNMDWVPILIANHHRIDPTQFEPDPQFDTIFRVLEIDNEIVRNQLIIAHAIEQSLLIERRQTGYDIMFSGGKPRNVKACYTLNDKRRDFGHRLSWMGRGNPEVSGVKFSDRPPRMRSDVDSRLAHQQGLLAELLRELRDLGAQYTEAQGVFKRSEQAIVKHKRNFTTVVKVNIQSAEEQLERLENDLEADSGAEGKIQAWREDLKQVEKDLGIDKANYGNVGLAMEEANATSTERNNELNRVKEQVDEAEHKLSKAQAKERNSGQAREFHLRGKNDIIERIKLMQAEVVRAEKKRDMGIERVEQFRVQAEAVSLRIPVPEGKSSEQIQTEFNEVKKQIQAAERRQGATDQEIKDAYITAEREFKRAAEHRRELEATLGLLQQSFQKRLVMYRRFQQHISCRSRVNFHYFLSNRGFRGNLEIDHVSKLLDVHVEPDLHTRSNKGRAAKTLSGGEKSFSSICLLLALWEAMGAPLRCLDEYDVFMDDVNRDTSTKMIISAARRSVGRQFILITPKSLGAGAADNSPDVKIIRLEDPRKKQMRIDAMMTGA